MFYAGCFGYAEPTSPGKTRKTIAFSSVSVLAELLGARVQEAAIMAGRCTRVGAEGNNEPARPGGTFAPLSLVF